jgi:hypothetical protein
MTSRGTETGKEEKTCINDPKEDTQKKKTNLCNHDQTFMGGHE